MAADSAEKPKYGPGPSQVTATGRRKRKDHGTAREAGKSWSADEERRFLEALDLCGTQSLVPCEPVALGKLEPLICRAQFGSIS